MTSLFRLAVIDVYEVIADPVTVDSVYRIRDAILTGFPGITRALPAYFVSSSTNSGSSRTAQLSSPTVGVYSETM